jgi:hypothetical protein
MKSVQIQATKSGARLFRNNVGLGWIGSVQRPRVPMLVNLMPGDVLLRQARPIHFGLCDGSSDLIGWHPVTITHDMVGKTFARFLACEVKTDTGRVTAEQQAFLDAVREAGGIATISRSERDIAAALLSS